MKSLLNKYAFNIWSKYFLTSISILSFISWFIPTIPDDKQFLKYIIGISLIVLSFVSYLIIAIYEKSCKKVHLRINNTSVNIIFGDIFDANGIKVIAFNEYFDSIVDNEVINSDSLNGQLFKHINKDDFDLSIINNTTLIKTEENKNRKYGKKQKYAIGQIHKFNEDYYALSFSKFNDKNEACLYSYEYANCLIEMWKQLNTYYAQSAINIPLLGDGITRILNNTTITKQELLETILETLKISNITFKNPSKINIVLWPGNNNENYKCFDFSKIKMMFN